MDVHYGVNDIPVSNSKGRCLLENWVEEVSVIVMCIQ